MVNGGFTIALGNSNAATGAVSWSSLFQNGTSFSGLSTTGCPGGVYTPLGVTDDRTLYLYFSGGPFANPQTSPAIPLRANAQNAMLSGYAVNGVPSTGQVLAFDLPTQQWLPTTIAPGLNSLTLNMPASIFTNPSTITANGSYNWTFASQTQNTFLAAPSAANGTPSFRSLVSADLPTVGVAQGGTGATTATGALTNLLPSQAANGGMFLTTNGTTTSWASAGTGSVTSVNVAAPFMTSSGAVTSSGTVTMSYSNQSAKTVLAAPNAALGTPSFRTLLSSDIQSSVAGNWFLPIAVLP